MTTHASIAERQRSPESARLYKAFSWYYKRAKRWRAARRIGTLGLAAMSPVMVYTWPESGKWLAASAGAWLLISKSLFENIERHYQRGGAQVHEQFDRDIFQLEWDPKIAGYQVAEEDIEVAAKKFRGDSTRVQTWYPDTKTAPRLLAIVLCQRSSAVWGRRDHEAYAALLAVAAASWFALGIALALTKNLSLADYLVQLFLPSQPAFVDIIELAKEHRTLSKIKLGLERRLTDLVEPGASISETTCCDVQNQFMRLRSSGAQIPEILYSLRRKHNEPAMHEAAARILARKTGPPQS